MLKDVMVNSLLSFVLVYKFIYFKELAKLKHLFVV